MTVPDAKAVRLRAGAVAWRKVEGEIVAIDLEASEYMAINATGAELWPALVNGASRQELWGRLVAVFEVEPSIAARDVDAFLEQLAERGLLEAA